MYKQSLLILSILTFLSLGVNAQSLHLTAGQVVPDFTLKDIHGKIHALSAYRGKYVVIGFVGTKCQIANAYTGRMNAIAADYQPKNVIFLGINSNANEPLKIVKEHAAKANYGFAILKDQNNSVADTFGATVTPEMYIVDPQGVLRYHGRIDNASDARNVERQDLRIALDELLEGKSISKPDLKAFGCLIHRTTAKPFVVAALRVQAATTTTYKVELLKAADFTKLKDDSKGKVMVINFWATWCAPCVAEFPEFVKIDQDYRARGVRVISISTDDKTDIEKMVIPFLKKQKAEFEAFLSAADDPQELIDVVDKNWSGALPSTFVFDKQGKLILKKYGIIDRQELLASIDAALKE